MQDTNINHTLLSMYQLELQAAGLSSKEVSTYMVLLTMGPSSVQSIARKAKIARGTTYVILDSLIKRGLVCVQKTDKRRLFVAERPERIIGMLEEKKVHVEQDIAAIESLLPSLHAIMKAQEIKPVVRYYEGEKGLRLIRQEMVMYSKSNDVWYNFAPADALERVFGEEEMSCMTRIQKGITSKSIAFTSSESLQNTLTKRSKRDCTERKFFTNTSGEINCGLTIFRDRVAMGCFDEHHIGGMIIESPSLAALLTLFFQLSWNAI
jgi:HTH-type transcriptional regulator, sugar sensing transcriptional regulator